MVVTFPRSVVHPVGQRFDGLGGAADHYDLIRWRRGRRGGCHHRGSRRRSWGSRFRPWLGRVILNLRRLSATTAVKLGYVTALRPLDGLIAGIAQHQLDAA